MSSAATDVVAALAPLVGNHISAILRTQSRTSRPIDWEHVDRWARFWGISDRADELRR